MVTPIADDAPGIRAAIERIRREEALATELAAQVASGVASPAWAREQFERRTREPVVSWRPGVMRRLPPPDALTDDEVRQIVRDGGERCGCYVCELVRRTLATA
jgi:hypothetical protein